MNVIKNSFLAVLVFFLLSFSSNENVKTIATKDYAVNYNDDIVKIENYLKTHSATVVDHRGFSDDQNVTLSVVENLSTASIWGSDPAIPKSSLLFKNVTLDGVVHKIYYLKFREGTGANPTNNNQIKLSYKGSLLNDFVFDVSPERGTTFSLKKLIIGCREILLEFKSGTLNGKNQYENFGAGVMFLPSAVGYSDKYNRKVPAYSPLIFSFKLYNVL